MWVVVIIDHISMCPWHFLLFLDKCWLRNFNIKTLCGLFVILQNIFLAFCELADKTVLGEKQVNEESVAILNRSKVFKKLYNVVSIYEITISSSWVPPTPPLLLCLIFQLSREKLNSGPLFCLAYSRGTDSIFQLN